MGKVGDCFRERKGGTAGILIAESRNPLFQYRFTELDQTAPSTGWPLPVSLNHLQVSIKISMEKYFIHSPHIIITTITTHHKTTPCETALRELPSFQKPLYTRLALHTTDCQGKNSIVTALNKGWTSSWTNAVKCSYRSSGNAVRHKHLEKKSQN